MEQAEVSYYEANLCYNIMIINLAYESVETYKSEKANEYQELLKKIS